MIKKLRRKLIAACMLSLAVVLLVLVIVGALMGGVKAGTPMFQAVGAVLLVVALVMFFMKKKD